jgi:hypothetical protein
MPNFAKAIRPYVTQEIQLAQLRWAAGQRDQAFRHLERAHVLGQSSTVQHVRTHWHMFVWGIRSKSFRERKIGVRYQLMSITSPSGQACRAQSCLKIPLSGPIAVCG